jgi:hypothetical protein
MRARTLSLVAILGLAVLLPAVVAWSQDERPATHDRFRVTWSPMTEGPPPVIQGRVYNESSTRVTDVQLEIEGLDGAGREVGRKFGWAIGDIVPGGETSFVVESIPGAESYRVRVHSFDIVSGPAHPRHDARD